MSSHKFERVKRENPELATLLDLLMDYIARQRSTGQDFIVPKLAAAGMKLNDGEAYVLLELLARAGLVKRAFNVYCKNSEMLLATVDQVDMLDVLPYCDYCGSEHDVSDLRIEIAFQPLLKNNGFTKAA